MSKVNRNESKKPNVYKVVLNISPSQESVKYFSALGKIERYLEDFVDSNFDEECEILLTRGGIPEEMRYCEFGKLIDRGDIHLLSSDLIIPIKIYKIKIN